MRYLFLTAGGILAVFSATFAYQQASPTASTSDQRAVLDKYCVTCHNQRLKTGGLTLDNLDLAKIPEQAEVWEKVIGKLHAGTMPPAGLPRPDAATYKNLSAWLETQIDQAAAPYAGHPMLHRL